MSLPPDYWKQDATEVRKFFEEQVNMQICIKNFTQNRFLQVGPDLPPEVRTELDEQEKRIANL